MAFSTGRLEAHRAPGFDNCPIIRRKFISAIISNKFPSNSNQFGGGEGGRRREGEQLPLITNGRWRPFCTFKFPRLYISFNGGRRTTDRSALAAKQSTTTPSRTRNQSDDGQGAERPSPGGPRPRHLATAFPTHRGIHYFRFNFDSGALLAGKLATALISFIRV